MRIAGLCAAGLLLVACGSSPPAPTAFHLDTSVQALHDGQVIDGVPCLSGDIPEHHLHVHLAVYVDGVQAAVPAGIGVGRPWGFDSSGFLATGSCYSWLHTHDTTGVVHIAMPGQQVFDLRQIFEVWGQPLSATGAFNYSGTVKILVDGRPAAGDPGVLPLLNYANVVIELGRPPSVEPASIYDFATMSR